MSRDAISGHAPRDAPTTSLARLPTGVGITLRRRRLREKEILNRETGCFDQPLDLIYVLLAFGLVYALVAAHDTCPRSRPSASSQASARSRPSAMAVTAPAAFIVPIVASCLSVARPPSAFSSSAKQRPLWIAMTSGTPATTPRPFMIAASTGLR